jgi:hypothetical protein
MVIQQLPKNLDLERLFCLRLAIARLGEMDNSGWWNTKGLLGSNGAFVYRRGFPRTHAFAQARVVFAVAADRCAEVFLPKNGVTLWHFPVSIEDLFEDRWQSWLDESESWQPFFAQIAALRTNDVLEALQALKLVSDTDITDAKRLRKSVEGRAVLLPDGEIDDAMVTLLAAGFAHSEVGKPVVPYMRVDA